MIIIPSLNITDEDKTKELLPKLFKLKKEKNIENIHIDISDGKFSKTYTPLPPQWFESNLEKYFNFFVHFMVDDLENYLEKWSNVKNFKKISFHLNSHFDIDNLIFFSQKRNIPLEIVFGINDNFYEFLEMVPFYKCNSVQFLAVPPGPSGQTFDKSILEKTKIFKVQYPNIEVFVDGGVNDKNISNIKESGVDGVVVGSYLWQSEDVLKAYDTLNVI